MVSTSATKGYDELAFVCEIVEGVCHGVDVEQKALRMNGLYSLFVKAGQRKDRPLPGGKRRICARRVEQSEAKTRQRSAFALLDIQFMQADDDSADALHDDNKPCRHHTIHSRESVPVDVRIAVQKRP